MRKALIILAIAGVVLVAIDRVAKVVVEAQAEERIQQTFSLAGRPDVTVRGFPFLTQIVGGELDRVDLVAAEVPVGSVTGRDVRLTASRITLLSGYEGRAARVEGSLLLSYADLARLVREAGVPPVELDYGGEPGLVAITAELTLPTGPIEVVAFSAIRAEGREVTTMLSRIEVDGAPAPAVVADAVGGRLNLTFELPAVSGVGEIAIDSVRTTQDGTVIALSGDDIAVG